MKNIFQKKLKKINQAIYYRFNLLLHRDGEDFQYLRFFDIKTCEWVDETFPLIDYEMRLNHWVKRADETRKNLVQKTPKK